MTCGSTESANSLQVSVASFLQKCLATKLSSEARDWLSQKCDQLNQQASPLAFYTAFSAMPRFVGKHALALNELEMSEASAIHPMWQPGDWTVDQAGRCLLLLAFEKNDADRYVSTVEQLFSTADERELIALYRILPLLPHQERFIARAAEGVRSNMSSVFHAIALHNPYPFEHFDEQAWNQLVLKVAFIGSPLSKIIGLHARANPALANMLHDLVHERRAAGRSFSPDIWQLIAPYADAEMAKDLYRALNDHDPSHRVAAAKALAAISHFGQTEIGAMPSAQN